MVIVDGGKVIARGTPAAVIGGLNADSIVELFPAEGADLEESDLAALPGVGEVRREGAAFTLVSADTQASVGALLAHLSDRGVQLESLQTHAPTLEDVFVALTGKHLRDG